jgi:hypothetical protein
MNGLPPIVFAGPSLNGFKPLGCALRPPAAAGDLLALINGSPRTIVLIDGVFDCAAPVQHKEILELLYRGFPVIGGASMGALRAAELHTYGMQGVGRIFSAYASGRLTADDEVAVLHAPADLDHRAVTTALVDIRATLLAAARQRVVSVDIARLVLDAARSRFWRERDWELILSDVGDSVDSMRLRSWLPTGKVHLKRQDAMLCLAAAHAPKALASAVAPPPRTAFYKALAALHHVKL